MYLSVIILYCLVVFSAAVGSALDQLRGSWCYVVGSVQGDEDTGFKARANTSPAETNQVQRSSKRFVKNKNQLINNQSMKLSSHCIDIGYVRAFVSIPWIHNWVDADA